MRTTVSLPLVLAIGLVGHGFGQASRTAFLVRISEWQTSLQATMGPNNIGNCLIVRPDGHAHLELRRQEFFNGRASLSTYEFALDNKQMELLRSILEDPEVRSLDPFVQPVVPMEADDWHVFGADIVHGVGVQHVGFLTWHGKGPTNPDADKSAWEQSSAALRPLVEWSRGVKSYKSNWRRVHNPNTTCGE